MFENASSFDILFYNALKIINLKCDLSVQILNRATVCRSIQTLLFMYSSGLVSFYVFESLLYLLKLQLFDQTYSKSINIMKYYYNKKSFLF